MSHWLKNIAEFLCLAAIVLGTFAFGGVLGWGLVLMFIPIAAAFCLCLGRGLLPGQQPPHLAPRGRRVVFGLLILFGLYVFAQLVPLPPAWIAFFSPARVGFASQYGQALNDPAPHPLPIGMSPADTAQAIRLAAMGFMAFYLGAALGGSRRRSHRLLRGLILMVLIEALYGLGEDLSGRHSILGFETPFNVACGTFYNRNHFAALLALFVPISLGWTYYSIRPRHQHRRRESPGPRGLNDGLFSRQGLWMLVPVVLMLGVVQSASRGGTGSMLLGTALFFALAARSRSVRALSWVTAGLGLIIFIYAYNSDYQLVLGRMNDLFENCDGREIIWKDSMKIIRDFPVFGVGLGNFSKVYSRYATLDTVVYPNQAHNEWMEGFVTLGIAGMILVILALGVFFTVTFLDLRRHRDGQLWRLGAWCGLIGLSVHCFGEFNLHIPSILVTALFIAGVLLGSMSGEKSQNPREAESS